MGTDDIVALAGRLLLSIIFLASAFGIVTNFEGTVSYAEAYGLPLAPLLCGLAAVLEALCGLALMLGFYARWSAAILCGFTIAATWIFYHGPDHRIHMLKNIAIVGGLLQVVAFGSGSLSFEGSQRSA